MSEQPRQDTMTQRPMSDAAKASTAGYAWNPVSGRFVKKSGPTYLRLIKCGVLTDPSLFVVQRAAPTRRKRQRQQRKLQRPDDGKRRLRPNNTAMTRMTMISLPASPSYFENRRVDWPSLQPACHAPGSSSPPQLEQAPAALVVGK